MYRSVPMFDSYMDEDEGDYSLGYQQTLMYGRYSKSLGEYIREETKRRKEIERHEFNQRQKELSGKEVNKYGFLMKILSNIWKHTFYRIGCEDWVFLALLGIIMSLISFCMDFTIMICNQARLWMVKSLITQTWLKLLAWTFLPTFLILFSTGFVHLMAPQAIGSGIPELKTIMRGVNLKEYLTFRTLIAKVVGLTTTLGSGMPLGKEGPFVHTASCVASLLTKVMGSFQTISDNPTRKSEMLAAACAVGVSCCFGAPIGGVLFSIEVTSSFFAIRNYWRGFFAATFGAVIFKLVAFWILGHPTFFGLFKTEFLMEVPYDPKELIVYAIIGVICGLGGALYVYLHRRYVLWMRGCKQLNKFLQKNRFIYPFLIASFLSMCTFPDGPGKFQAGDLTTHRQVTTLFSNFTWTRNISEISVSEYKEIKHWIDPYTGSIFLSLGGFSLYAFLGSILASTLPVPTGVVIPSFKTGAGIGRAIGELMHLSFPLGLTLGNPILPGGYAVVGAAAFTGAVTRTISISMIVFEMTGQKTHSLPILMAVIISNCIASLLQPSCFDSIIIIKKLPYLPNIIPSSSRAHNYFVESFMLSEVKHIWHSMTYQDLKMVLMDAKKLKMFPLVDNPEKMILLGSVTRYELILAIERQISKEKRRKEAMIRQRAEEVRKLKDEMLREAEKRIHELEHKPDRQLHTVSASGDQPSGARKMSRFSVSTVDISTNQTDDSDASTVQALLDSSSPKKSILKKHKSFTVAAHDATLDVSPYDTWRNTVHNIGSKFRGSANTSRNSTWDFRTGTDYWNHSGKKKFFWPDLTLEEQKDWEEKELSKQIDFSMIQVDPAPFQLVEKSSLLKVHGLFSMLGIKLAYVTSLGKLIGVVGLAELRQGIENVNSGQINSEEADEEMGPGKGAAHGDEKENGLEVPSITVQQEDNEMSDA